MVTAVGVQKSILAVVLIGAIAAIVVADDQTFPFSNFSMYSKKFSPKGQVAFWTIVAEFEDGSIRRFDTMVGGEAGLQPFWGASFREALLVEKNLSVVSEKLKATVSWQRSEAARSGFSASRTVKKLMLYKHEIPWLSLVELRMRDASVRPLFFEYAELVAEAQ